MSSGGDSMISEITTAECSLSIEESISPTGLWLITEESHGSIVGYIFWSERVGAYVFKQNNIAYMGRHSTRWVLEQLERLEKEREFTNGK